MIFIDGRIGSIELSHTLNYIDAPYQLSRLEFADIMFIGNGPDGPLSIGVERKRLTDLLSSIDTGRLSGHQLIGMLETYDIIYLMVEGVWRSNRDGILQHHHKGKWTVLKAGHKTYTYRYVTNYLNTLSIITGVRVFITSDIQSSARWLYSLFKWWDKDWGKHRAHLGMNKSSLPSQRIGEAASFEKATVTQRMLAELKGVGWDRSKKLAERFPIMEMIMNASVEEIMEAEGIGKTLAVSIFNELHGL